MEATSSEERIRQLEHELEEMTAALAHAWDQLVPFLQEAPQHARSPSDLLPVLESLLAAVDAEMGAVYLIPKDGSAPRWYTVPSDIVAPSELQKYMPQLQGKAQPLTVHDVPSWNGKPTRWLLMPMVISGEMIGAVGVGHANAQREFNAFDARVMVRMTERVTNQMVATTLAESQARELQAVRDLQIAGLIQRSIQPHSPPQIPGLQVAADWQPASSVGGDVWGWALQPSGRLACFMADVAGKGLPAALAAVSLHTALSLALRMDLSPSEVLRIVNDEVYEPYTATGLLSSAVVITIDPESKLVEHASAGHPPVLVRRGGEWQRWGADMPPLGVLLDVGPETHHEAGLRSGDVLVAYSDGFTEIETARGLWGERGLIEAIPPGANSASDIMRAILKAAAAARGSRPYHDDQTILVIGV